MAGKVVYEEDLLEDIRRELRVRRKGDVDAYQIASELGKSREAARKYAERKVKEGKWEYGGVVWDADKRKNLSCWRKRKTQ